jgi:orotidine-5'-phosphate decarboxylase
MRDRFYSRLEKVVADKGPMCVGLDPSKALLTEWGLADDAAGVEQLVMTTIDAVANRVGIVKPQVAFFERHGAAGFAVLERTLAHAHDAGLLTIADAKRGDIQPTNEGYADAWLRETSPLAADAMTVTCYLGARALAPNFELAHATGRGVFAVAASSNPEGRRLQEAIVDGRTKVETALLEELGAINASLDELGPQVRCVGAVIGATRLPEGLSEFEGPVLVTGVGAQGAATDDVRTLRAAIRHNALAVNVARSLLSQGPSPAALAAAAERFADAIG